MTSPNREETVSSVLFSLYPTKTINPILTKKRLIIQSSLVYLLFILAEIIDASSTANSQASGEEPETKMNPEVLQLLREGEQLPLGLL